MNAHNNILSLSNRKGCFVEAGGHDKYIQE